MRFERMQILAPGKLVLMGEYAVRHGSPGAVFSVDRLARLSWLPYAKDIKQDLVSQARVFTAQLLGIGQAARCSVDSSGFYLDAYKLGLGSSAAVTVASVASVFWEAGLDIHQLQQRKKIWSIAKEVHDGFQGVSGSGIDLAASVFGGIVVMEKASSLDDGLFRHWELPEGLELVFCWTGTPSSTFSLVDAVDRWSTTHVKEHAGIMCEMTDVAESFCNSLAEVTQTLDAIERYGQLMDKLGLACDVPVYTAAMKQIAVLAKDLGGTAKPSGAGGGDFMMAAFADRAASAEFKSGAKQMGALPIDFEICKEGVRAFDSAAFDSGPDSVH